MAFEVFLTLPITHFLHRRIVAVAFVYQLPFFDRWFSFMDEGHILLYADMIANGGELYRDATVATLADEAAIVAELGVRKTGSFPRSSARNAGGP